MGENPYRQEIEVGIPGNSARCFAENSFKVAFARIVVSLPVLEASALSHGVCSRHAKMLVLVSGNSV